MYPNRLGLGLRPPMPSYGQGPSISALAQQQQMHNQQFMPPSQKLTTLFVGSISGGISDGVLNQLLAACGPLKSFKRLITPANKPQGFGFAEFEEPDGALRALVLLNGVELPAMEDGCANKKLLVKADEKTKMFLDAYQAQRMPTDTDDALMQQAKQAVAGQLAAINESYAAAATNGGLDREKYVIPPHLHDLHEADLPETQRGLVISEIALFRERAAKREREKMRDVSGAVAAASSAPAAPSGPKQREWGKPQGTGAAAAASPQSPGGRAGRAQSFGRGKPPAFVREDGAGEERALAGKSTKTDEELEFDRRDARRRDEDSSFRDRERRYEPRERTRIAALERAIARERAMKDAEDRDRIEMRARLDVWDDDESDELFYTDRARWRVTRARRLATEEAADAESRQFEDKEADNLRRESEEFLARQMDEMQALADEQRRAGMLLDDGAPVRLHVSLAPAAPKADAHAAQATVFGAEEEDEGFKKRKVPLVKLDFSVAEGGEKTKERLERIREAVPRDKDELFKSKVRWDALSDELIDRKLEPLVKRQMVKYLGELEDDDMVMFVLEHLKDHKGPQKLVDGLEPVLEEEAVELAISIWRQVIFESTAYGEGIHTERALAD